MTTRPLVDPELVALLDQLPSIELNEAIIKQVRTMTQTQRFSDLPSFPGIEVTEHFVPGPEGAPEVRVLLYQPTTEIRPVPALLWMHGGGYVMGSPEQEDLMVKKVVSVLGCVAVSVGYRLAPETHHPGPVEDCYAALQWLHTHTSKLGVDPARIALVGSSAGGGLAAALGLLARDRGEIPLAFQLLIAPMLDDRTCIMAEPHPYTGEFIWTREANRFGWTSLLGQEPGGPDVSPYAAAARAEDLEGLPPTFINVGALDLFLEEDLEFARRLTRAGVPTEFHIYPGAYHGFRMVADAQVTQIAARDQLTALKRALRIQ
ncbi:acetyl esterase/lipase [Thermosporothrix hazakensis]|jgi:acetyl esterase/lipase|uniref:Acetyl esterase/lipase n=2 Tax=Thermosporothrix TaxID=768650 RepID=A0A326U3W7_THEHA|nr:alpha/beta hydrolase [Thermosporothrix hazakensis]PZW27119.1 acetyl esterase/lipase [Thermosporothrix hazakensis]BBH87988.1 esterase [Thermosporothrix sp. COM3]GCE50402.1 esterase [Thermosporothrix hazakensis]